MTEEERVAVAELRNTDSNLQFSLMMFPFYDQKGFMKRQDHHDAGGWLI